MKNRLVLDTNVLISALVFGGKPEKVYQRILTSHDDGFVSLEILTELRGVLTGKKFSYAHSLVDFYISEIQSIFQMVYPEIRLNVIQRDPQDNRVLECAIEAKAHFIISGDNDLLDLKKYQEIKIYSPQEFLAEIKNI